MDANPSSTFVRRVVRRRVLCGALFLCFASFAFSHWVLWPVKVAGDSMTPNYEDGQPNFINKLAYFSEAPQRGDVVGVRAGGLKQVTLLREEAPKRGDVVGVRVNDGEFLLKRVIGLPGEKIEFKRGTIIVNGRPLAEPYIRKPLLWALPPVQLGPEDYFVMGDNRTTSMLGAVAKKQHRGQSGVLIADSRASGRGAGRSEDDRGASHELLAVVEIRPASPTPDATPTGESDCRRPPSLS